MSDSASEAVDLKSPRVQVNLVETPEQLQAAVADLAGVQGAFAVDAERASGFRYGQRAYLVQVYRPGTQIHLIDVGALAPTLPTDSLDELAALLRADEWILHAATQDLGCLAELGLTPVRLFDTELAGRLAGLERVGLGSMAEALLGLKLAKEHSAVDWSQRPMHDDWLTYAALDVDVLPQLRAEIEALLVEQNKLEWALEEFEALLSFKPKPPKQDKWRGLSGLHEVKDTRKLAIARELWSARETLAQKIDTAPGRLIPDSSIIAVVKTTPRSKSELAGFRAFAGRASRTYLDTWWKAIETGVSTLDLPALKLPATGIPNHRIWAAKFPEANARLKASRDAVSAIATENGLPTENLVSPDFVRQLCWAPPAELTELEVTQALLSVGARAWQCKLIASALCSALAAEPNAEDQPAD